MHDLELGSRIWILSAFYSSMDHKIDTLKAWLFDIIATGRRLKGNGQGRLISPVQTTVVYLGYRLCDDILLWLQSWTSCTSQKENNERITWPFPWQKKLLRSKKIETYYYVHGVSICNDSICPWVMSGIMYTFEKLSVFKCYDVENLIVRTLKNETKFKFCLLISSIHGWYQQTKLNY